MSCWSAVPFDMFAICLTSNLITIALPVDQVPALWPLVVAHCSRTVTLSVIVLFSDFALIIMAQYLHCLHTCILLAISALLNFVTIFAVLVIYGDPNLQSQCTDFDLHCHMAVKRAVPTVLPPLLSVGICIARCLMFTITFTSFKISSGHICEWPCVRHSVALDRAQQGCGHQSVTNGDGECGAQRMANQTMGLEALGQFASI